MSIASIGNRKRFLITTADERTWRTDQPVLFLGEWCRRYDRSSIWQNLDAEVVPYHWDDHSKLNKDYLYLRELYEEILVDLSDSLNQFHEVNHSKRYWRILLGPWLRFFTQILFDRWTMIQHAVKDFDVTGSIVLDLTPEQVIPNDMNDFAVKWEDDPWNSFIYGQILINYTNVPCDKIVVAEFKSSGLGSVLPVGAPRRSLFRRLSLAIAKKIFGTSLLTRPTEFFFISSYLPLLSDFRLQVLLGQAPKLWKSPPVPGTRFNLDERERLNLVKPEQHGFEHCVRSLIPKQIPTLYLEGFSKLKEILTGLPWPTKPKFIFTSNNFESDDIFKTWAASKVENGSNLIIGQHGGMYGATLWMCTEDHEILISDRYLTWGWSNEYPNVYPAAALKLIGKTSVGWNPSGGLLMVTQDSPRYSHVIYPGSIASQLSDYLEDLFRFAGSLPNDIRAMLLVRLLGYDYGWSPAARWRDRYPDVKVNNGSGTIESLIRRSRMVVETYHGTTHLETLGQNIPTIIFWNPDHWELRPSANSYFGQLKEAGIFHESPESAAAKIAEVWDDVKGWWSQPYIQDARRYFCDRFARMPEKPIGVLLEALTTVGNRSKS